MFRLSTFAPFFLALGCLAAVQSARCGQTPASATSPAAANPAPPAAANSAALPTSAAPKMHFRDVSAESGLTTVPHSSPERRYVLETMGGGGVALFDCDNDGKLDIAVVNDSTIEQFLQGGDPMLTLYHQDPNSAALHFTDITPASGLTTKGWGMAIAVGDSDNDGLPDLYVTGYGHNVLYRNLGNFARAGRRNVNRAILRNLSGAGHGGYNGLFGGLRQNVARRRGASRIIFIDKKSNNRQND